jgi:hypothetical protein
MMPVIAEKRAAEPAAHENLPNLLPVYFNTLAAAQTDAARKRINAKLALAVSG